jgi:hypothetical protein
MQAVSAVERTFYNHVQRKEKGVVDGKVWWVVVQRRLTRQHTRLTFPSVS